MRGRYLYLALAAFLLSATPLLGAPADQVGIVKSSAGRVAIVRNGSALRVVPNTPLYAGDIVATGRDGKAGLILEDDTVISLGPKSRISIEDFVYRPEENKLSLVARIFKGTATFVAGRIAKLAPNRVHIQTPHGTVGLRGTHVLVRVG